MSQSPDNQAKLPKESLGPILGPIQCPQCSERSLMHLTGAGRLKCLECDFSQVLSKPDKPKPSGPVGGLGMFLGMCLVVALFNGWPQEGAQPSYQPQHGDSVSMELT